MGVSFLESWAIGGFKAVMEIFIQGADGLHICFLYLKSKRNILVNPFSMSAFGQGNNSLLRIPA
jgi:hypothetical protein